MRADIVHVTDHALLRWRERAAAYANATVDEIITAVKESTQLTDTELLPYPTIRKPNTVYSVLKQDIPILFILETVTRTEYRLITVVADARKELKKEVKEEKPVELPRINSFLEEKCWLLSYKKKVETELSLAESGLFRENLRTAINKINKRLGFMGTTYGKKDLNQTWTLDYRTLTDITKILQATVGVE